MEKVKVCTDFSSKKYSDTEISVTATNILDNMTDNLNFTTPTPPIADVRATVSSYLVSLAKAEKGSPDDRVIKSSWRAKLEEQLKDLSLYVQLTSKGDAVIISSSGFDTNKKHGTIGPLYKPENVSVKMGDNKGSVWFACDAIDRSSFYEFEYAEVTADGILNWIHKTSTKHKILIEGLTSGKQYVFRVAGAGSDPSRVWSDEITTFVI
jgi:hypothetical protein